MSKMVNAAVQLDNTCIHWKAQFTFEDAYDFCAKREVVYSHNMDKLIHFAEKVFEGKCVPILEIGREYSRVVYIKWGVVFSDVPALAFDSLRGIADEFDVTVDGAGWACLRVWWD